VPNTPLTTSHHTVVALRSGQRRAADRWCPKSSSASSSPATFDTIGGECCPLVPRRLPRSDCRCLYPLRALALRQLLATSQLQLPVLVARFGAPPTPLRVALHGAARGAASSVRCAVAPLPPLGESSLTLPPRPLRSGAPPRPLRSGAGHELWRSRSDRCFGSARSVGSGGELSTPNWPPRRVGRRVAPRIARPLLGVGWAWSGGRAGRRVIGDRWGVGVGTGRGGWEGGVARFGAPLDSPARGAARGGAWRRQ
jgi:hypothetical protein